MDGPSFDPMTREGESISTAFSVEVRFLAGQTIGS
jgi:hypothetical protein